MTWTRKRAIISLHEGGLTLTSLRRSSATTLLCVSCSNLSRTSSVCSSSFATAALYFEICTIGTLTCGVSLYYVYIFSSYCMCSVLTEYIPSLCYMDFKMHPTVDFSLTSSVLKCITVLARPQAPLRRN